MRQRQHKDKERKMNTQIKVLTAAELLLVDVCVRVGGRGRRVNELLYA